MFQPIDHVIKINATHSHTKTVLAEIRFRSSSLLAEVKSTLSQKFGTLPEYMKLKLIKQSGEERPFSQYDDDKTLKDLEIEDYDTIHVTDFNPNGILVQNDIDDLAAVKKYEISNEEYDKRDDNVRKFRQKLQKNPNYQKMIKESQGPSYEEEASKIQVGQRCLIGDGTRRGEVKYVGKVKGMGYGFWIGIALDEPMGDSNGSFGDKQYFVCENNYGIFLRPTYVKVGDYPPIDEFDENFDEI
jgi:tubulin-folding cofactor B